MEAFELGPLVEAVLVIGVGCLAVAIVFIAAALVLGYLVGGRRE